MEHVREIDLIEFVAKRLDAERRRILLSHLEDCPACRAKLDSIAKTWDILGAWEVQPARDIDIARHVDSSESRGKESARSVIRFPTLGVAMRVAAAIAIATVVGYTGGRWSIRPANTVLGAEPPRYVSVLALEIGASLSPLVLQDGSAPEQEGGS